jgi:hypothetical protein
MLVSVPKIYAEIALNIGGLIELLDYSSLCSVVPLLCGC